MELIICDGKILEAILRTTTPQKKSIGSKKKTLENTGAILIAGQSMV